MARSIARGDKQLIATHLHHLRLVDPLPRPGLALLLKTCIVLLRKTYKRWRQLGQVGAQSVCMTASHKADCVRYRRRIDVDNLQPCQRHVPGMAGLKVSGPTRRWHGPLGHHAVVSDAQMDVGYAQGGVQEGVFVCMLHIHREEPPSAHLDTPAVYDVFCDFDEQARNGIVGRKLCFLALDVLDKLLLGLLLRDLVLIYAQVDAYFRVKLEFLVMVSPSGRLGVGLARALWHACRAEKHEQRSLIVSAYNGGTVTLIINMDQHAPSARACMLVPSFRGAAGEHGRP
jgi:hypothetical protein